MHLLAYKVIKMHCVQFRVCNIIFKMSSHLACVCHKPYEYIIFSRVQCVINLTKLWGVLDSVSQN